MNNLLKQIFLNHTDKISDKWTLYINEWDRIFSPYHDLPINLFEIGVQNGGSLEIWAKYFKNAQKIVGCDIDEKCRELKFADPRIALFVGDANSDEIQKQILESAPKYDVILDDGSHRSSDVIRSFCRYFPFLEYDGIYVIEDLHTSYWEEFEGSLFNPESSMSFLKHLADIVNHEHWRNNQSRAEFLSEFSKTLEISFSEADLLSIHSIEFINSLCILRKCRPADNILGNRIIVGKKELVTTGMDRFNGTSIHDLTVAINDDSELEIWKLIKRNEDLNSVINILKNELAAEKANAVQEIQKLEMDLAAEKANAAQAVQKLEMDLAAEKPNAAQAVQKLEIDLAAEKANAEQAVQKLEIDLAAEKANAEQAVQKLEMDLAAEKVNAEQAVQKLEMDLAAEKVNTASAYPDLEQKSQEFNKKMAAKDSAHSSEINKLSDDKGRLEQEYSTQVSQNAELVQSLNFANHEIIDYYNSTSWKIIRPLRWLSKKLRGNNV